MKRNIEQDWISLRNLVVTSIKLVGIVISISLFSCDQNDGTTIDPSKVKVGEVVGGMTVRSTHFEESQDFVDARIDLEGSLTITGKYRYYDGSDEFMSSVLFFIPEKSEYSRVPKLKQYEGKVTGFELSFEKDDNRTFFGKEGSEGTAKIELSELSLLYQPKESWSQALVRKVLIAEKK